MFNLAANHTETYMLNINIQTIYGILGDPRFYEGYKLTFLSSAPVQNGAKYRYSTNVNFSSWGEYIDIDAIFINDNTTQITIKSECAVPTQFVSWGKNKKNVTDLYNYLVSALSGYINTVNTPPQAAPQNSVQPKFCIHCGAPLGGAAKFCQNCGNPVA